MKKLMLAAAFALALSPAAFAKGKGKGTAQNHHCEKDGAEVSATRKACTKQGGKWVKGAPASAAPAATPTK
jgi:hypothetical protein